MSVFVDTSALLAFLDADQPRHGEVIDAWERTVMDPGTGPGASTRAALRRYRGR